MKTFTGDPSLDGEIGVKQLLKTARDRIESVFYILEDIANNESAYLDNSMRSMLDMLAYSGKLSVKDLDKYYKELQSFEQAILTP